MTYPAMTYPAMTYPAMTYPDMTYPDMRYSVALLSWDSATGLKMIFRSRDPQLIQSVIAAMQSNRLHEEDEGDVIFDASFLANAEQVLADIRRQVRQQAADMFPSAAEDTSGAET